MIKSGSQERVSYGTTGNVSASEGSPQVTAKSHFSGKLFLQSQDELAC